MNKAKSLILALLLTVAAFPAFGQTTLNSTTLNEAVNNSETRIDIVSASNVSAGDIAFLDREAMLVLSVDSTNNRIRVQRGAAGTLAEDHGNRAVIWIDKAARFIKRDLSGACTSASEFPPYTPLINVSNGNVFRCRSSQWELEAPISALRSRLDQTLRFNVRSDYNNTTGDTIGFQVKPGQNAVSTGNVTGGEISPRLQDGVSSASITGLHVDVDLKGTTAVTNSGNVRGLEVELVTSNSGTRTISGYVAAMRFRTVFSATAITGNFTVFRIEKPEAQTNSQTYDAVFDFTSTIPLVWNDDPGTEPSTAAGYFAVIINGATRYVQLFSTAPTD